MAKRMPGFPRMAATRPTAAKIQIAGEVLWRLFGDRKVRRSRDRGHFENHMRETIILLHDKFGFLYPAGECENDGCKRCQK